MQMNPITYFMENEFSESLVLSICVNPEHHRLVFVVRYADIDWILEKMRQKDWPPAKKERNYDIDLRRLEFLGAVEVARTDSLYKHGFMDFDKNDLNLKPEHRLQTVIEYVNITAGDKGFYGKIGLGSFGVYKFFFSSLEVSRRLGKGISIGDQKWQYIDVTSGVPFDYYEPFESENNG